MKTILSGFCIFLFSSFQMFAQFDIESQVISPTQSSCMNGSIELTINGGYPPFEFEWSNGETTQNINNIVEDEYSVTVTDALCGEAILFFDDIVCMELQCSSLISYNDYGGNDQTVPGDEGFVNLNIQNSPLFNSVSISWSGPNGFTSQAESISNLENGDYSVTIEFETENGEVCIINHTFTIRTCKFRVPSPNGGNVHSLNSPNIQLNNLVSINSSNECSGEISVQGVPSGNTVLNNGTVYTYSWSMLGNPNFSSTSNSLLNLCEGTYCVEVHNGCGSSQECFEILPCNDPNNLDFEILVEPCPLGLNGEVISNGSVKVISNDKNISSINWDNNASGSSINNLASGTYCVTVTLTSGCQVENCITLEPQSTCTDIRNGSFSTTGTGIDPQTGEEVTFETLVCTENCFCDGILISSIERAPDCTFANNSGLACRSICGCPNGVLVSSPFVSNPIRPETRGMYWDIEATRGLCRWFADTCPLDDAGILETDITFNATCLGTQELGHGVCLFTLQCCRSLADPSCGPLCTQEFCGDVFTLVAGCDEFCGSEFDENVEINLRSLNPDSSEKQFISIYPNPSKTSEEVTIVLDIGPELYSNIDDIELDILSSTGQLLDTRNLEFRKHKFHTSLNLESYVDNVLFIRIKLDQGSIVRKLVRI